MSPPSTLPGRSARLAALGTGAVISTVVGLRVLRDGVQPYGSDGAEYIEHAARLAVREHVLRGEVLNPWRLLTTSDGSFPPLLHLVTLPLESATAAAMTGIGWMLLLAAAVGVVAARIGGRVELGAVAAAATLLVPAVHGMAARYYYDLPMIALLWCAVAVLAVGAESRPVRAGVGAGLLFWAAAITKWAALPFGPPMLLGALAVGMGAGHSGSEDHKKRILAGLLCASVAALLCLGFLAGRSGDNSFAKMGRVAFAEGSPSDWEGAGDAPGAVESMIGGVLSRVRELQVEDWAFYPIRLATSVFSPGGVLLVLVLVVIWLRTGARGAPLVGLTLAGHAAFLLGVMPVLDDRFVVVVAPALVIAAVLGWATLAPGPRRAVAAGAMVLGLTVALDFHFGPPAPWNTEVEVLVVDRDDFPPTHARGLGAASSTEQRGWARADRQADRREALRADLWAAVSACGASGLGLQAERALLREQGDLEWARYESLRSDNQPRVGVVCGPDGWWEHEVTLDLVAVQAGAGLPSCLDPRPWQRVQRLEAADGGPGVDLWATAGVCGP
ncbi:MAG: hypothetical protein GY898_15795 [Proteobacteria bacterium]|nr:hypothetical protein [Pseudomonadota bacterium]